MDDSASTVLTLLGLLAMPLGVLASAFLRRDVGARVQRSLTLRTVCRAGELRDRLAGLRAERARVVESSEQRVVLAQGWTPQQVDALGLPDPRNLPRRILVRWVDSGPYHGGLIEVRCEEALSGYAPLPGRVRVQLENACERSLRQVRAAILREPSPI